jgi:16S rRNA (cytidine1402-2'-O)-methyltransferase
MNPGKLYLIPNFIGEDPASNQFPLYNTEVITSLNYFFVENPKPARVLIKRLNKGADLDTIIFFHFDKHAKDNIAVYMEVYDCLKNGNDVGVVSDAGCPGIADPGAELVQWAHEKNITVVPLIGPSSILLTLMASGLNGQHFSFIGYLPKDGKEKIDRIKKISMSIQQTRGSILFIETPYKNEHTFKDLIQYLNPSDKLCMGIDLFSPGQQILVHPIGEWKGLKSLPVLKDKQVVFAVG